MKIDDHIQAYREHRETINWAIDRGIEKSQRIIGTHSSRAIVELLSAYLHKINAIDFGFQINHRWFKSQSVSIRLPDFPRKELLIGKMVELELQTENLTYGSQKTEDEIREVLKLLNEIEKILLEVTNGKAK